ncbi:hypothetical protein [Roseomonas sp. WA12]
MNRPLIIAVLSALLGFGFWTWLTGPGTSVPNALLALVCAVLFGRAGWWLAAFGEPREHDEIESDAPLPAPSQRRSAPPAVAESWRKPDERA